jgi:hypothetical protein
MLLQNNLILKLKGQKKLAGAWQPKRSYLVWKIERKPEKIFKTTFACRSLGYLFYGLFWPVINDVQA